MIVGFLICGFTWEFKGISERGVLQEDMDGSSSRSAVFTGHFSCMCGFIWKFEGIDERGSRQGKKGALMI